MKLKQIPEDFLVKEINNVALKKKGDYCYILLRKKNWTTTRIIESLANRLRVDLSKFQYAGLKDKDGITEQVISGYKIDVNFLKHIKIKDAELTILGFGNVPVRLGSHEGNKFTLVIRDLDHPLKAENLQIPNYFDDQRFGGSIRSITHKVGECLVQGNFEHAVKTLLCYPFEAESKENKVYREKVLCQWPDMSEIEVPKNLFDEKRVVESLQRCPQDYKRAITCLQRRILTLYIHAYQSYLFNLALNKYSEEQERYEYIEYVLGKLAVPLNEVKEKSISLIGFEIPGLPELDTRTVQRQAFATPKNFKMSQEEPDELNKGKKKQTLTFTLPSGAYATIVAKTIYLRSLAKEN